MVTCPSTRDEPINLITLGLFVFWITYLGVVMSFKLFVLTSICFFELFADLLII